jgi:hypothetical protein
MQVFHASRVLVLAAGLGVASTSFAAFSTGPQVGDAMQTRIDFGSMLAGAEPGGTFDSSFTITNAAGEESGVVRLAGIISPVGIVNFQVSVINTTDDPTAYSFAFGGLPFDVTDPVGRAFSVASVLDLNGDGAIMTGDHEGGAIVEFGYIPGPDASVAPMFDAQLLNAIIAGALSTASASDESSPAPGFLPIAGRVISLNASVKFVLSAGDQAQVQGAFMVLVPSPGAGLLGLAGATALLRRRRIN